MLTIQELEALRGLVQINVNINLLKGHHMAYDQTRLPCTWLPLSITNEAVAELSELTFVMPAGVTSLTVDASKLGGVNVSSGDNLREVHGGRLVNIAGGLVVNNKTLLTTLDFKSLSQVGGDIQFDGNAALTSINLSALSVLGGGLFASGAALPEAQVDALLLLLVNATSDGSTPWAGEVDLSGGTNAIPSATGLGYKTTLEGRGATVTVNS